ncbi:MAG: hypothetical protein KC517_01370 [Bacteroidetes bacterium]|jgi:hypothetical protein|nr:hypothetical protein [Bacteroidota bacterium]
MKLITFLSGSFGITLTLLGLLFEFMHWKGASIMLMTGMSALALLFIPSVTYLYYRGYKLVRIPTS